MPKFTHSRGEIQTHRIINRPLGPQALGGIEFWSAACFNVGVRTAVSDKQFVVIK
jgi:hypothetical protein